MSNKEKNTSPVRTQSKPLGNLRTEESSSREIISQAVAPKNRRKIVFFFILVITLHRIGFILISVLRDFLTAAMIDLFEVWNPTTYSAYYGIVTFITYSPYIFVTIKFIIPMLVDYVRYHPTE